MNLWTTTWMAAGATAAMTLGASAAMAQSAPATPDKPTVHVYSAQESDVNAYVLADRKGTTVIDATRNSREARKVGELAQAQGAAPSTLFITHGHPDHFLGMGELLRMFPKMRVTVASQAVKDDIVGFSRWMDDKGYLAKEPQMRPRSTQNPQGFDYEGVIQVLQTPTLTLTGGATLEVISNYPASEAEHETTLYSPDLNALFTGDLVYNKVHPWMGAGVTHQHIAQWKQTLTQLHQTYGPRRTTLYPGHGAAGDVSMLPALQTYMDTLLKVVSEATSAPEAHARMVALYPDYRNADYLLTQSIQFQMTQKR